MVESLNFERMLLVAHLQNNETFEDIGVKILFIHSHAKHTAEKKVYQGV